MLRPKRKIPFDPSLFDMQSGMTGDTQLRFDGLRRLAQNNHPTLRSNGINKRLSYQLAAKRVRRWEAQMQEKEYAQKLVRFPDRVAAIVGKTFTCQGDDFQLCDDEALGRIRDLIEELDSTLIQRNAHKRLNRGQR